MCPAGRRVVAFVFGQRGAERGKGDCSWALFQGGRAREGGGENIGLYSLCLLLGPPRIVRDSGRWFAIARRARGRVGPYRTLNTDATYTLCVLVEAPLLASRWGWFRLGYTCAQRMSVYLYPDPGAGVPYKKPHQKYSHADLWTTIRLTSTYIWRSLSRATQPPSSSLITLGGPLYTFLYFTIIDRHGIFRSVAKHAFAMHVGKWGRGGRG